MLASCGLEWSWRLWRDHRSVLKQKQREVARGTCGQGNLVPQEERLHAYLSEEPPPPQLHTLTYTRNRFKRCVRILQQLSPLEEPRPLLQPRACHYPDSSRRSRRPPMQHRRANAAQPPDLLWNKIYLECVLQQSSDCDDKVATKWRQ
jgi:hypothetical protein